MRIPDFVEWPRPDGTSTKNPKGVVRLCLIGNYAFGTMLGQEAGKASADGKRIELWWIRQEIDFKGCQIVFVSASEAKNYEKILNAAKLCNALTVGETDEFLAAGGIVELYFEDDKLKLQVNLTAARASQLRMDARFLAMAKRVIQEKPPPGT